MRLAIGAMGPDHRLTSFRCSRTVVDLSSKFPLVIYIRTKRGWSGHLELNCEKLKTSQKWLYKIEWA